MSDPIRSTPVRSVTNRVHTRGGSTRRLDQGLPVDPPSEGLPPAILPRVLAILVAAGLLTLMLRDWWIVLPGTLVVITLAFFAALAVEPIVVAVGRRGVPRGLAVMLLGVLALGVLAIVVLALLPSLRVQLASFRDGLPSILNQVLEHPWVQGLQSLLGASVDLGNIGQTVTTYFHDPRQLLALLGGFVSVSSGMAALAVGAALTFVLSIYFSLELPSTRAALSRSVRRSRRPSTMMVVDEMLDGIGRYLGGQAILAVMNGLVAFVIVAAVGGPTPILFAAIALGAAFIPVVGTPIGYSVAAVACFTTTSTQGFVASVVLLTYMLIEAYLLVPLVMMRAVKIPASLVIVGAMIGAAVGGLAGAFFAVPVIAVVAVVHRRVLVPTQERR